jgi:hypothetical protein
MKKLLPLVLLATGCGLFTPSVKSPCDGLYCVSVETTGVPGAALLCYQTAAERTAAVKQMQAEGKKVTIK